MLNQRITDLFHTPARSGDIGLELEVEGVMLPGEVPPYWKTHEDGSLRGESTEYVLRTPVAFSAVPEALNALDEAFKRNKSTFNLSRRTSVHVHLNCQKLLLQEIYNLIAMEFILDNLLVEYSGPDRIGNLFCLRAQDAEYLPLSVVTGLRRNVFFEFLNDNVRYGSMNLLALRNYGSIEFRSFRGSVDKKEIKQWVDVIHSLKQSACRYNDPRQIVQDLYDNGPEEFLRKNVPDEFFNVATGFKNWRRSMENGSHYAFEIAYATKNWLTDLDKARKEYVKARKLRPGEADENDPRFVGKSEEWKDMLLSMERNDGEFIRLGSNRWRDYAEYVDRQIAQIVEREERNRRERQPVPEPVPTFEEINRLRRGQGRRNMTIQEYIDRYGVINFHTEIGPQPVNIPNTRIPIIPLNIGNGQRQVLHDINADFEQETQGIERMLEDRNLDEIEDAGEPEPTEEELL